MHTLLSLRLLRGLAALLVLLLAVTITACDSSSSTDDPGEGPDDLPATGESSFALSGDLSKTSSGSARFATGADFDDLNGPGVAFVFYQTSGTEKTWLYLVATGSNLLPTPTTYDIVAQSNGDPDAYEAVYVSTSPTRSIVATPTSGRLTITRSETGRIEGTVSFDGTGYDVEEPPASVTASLSQARALGLSADKSVGAKNLRVTGTFRARQANRAQIQGVLEALDGGTVPAGPDGRASIRLTGGLTGDVNDALAAFANGDDLPGSDDDGSALLLYRVTPAETAWLIVYSEENDGVLRGGPHRILPLDEVAPGTDDVTALYVSTTSTGTTVVTPRSQGQLTISRTDGQRLDGFFGFNGEAFQIDDASTDVAALQAQIRAKARTASVPVNVSVSGTFQARRANAAKLLQLVDLLGLDDLDDIIGGPQLGDSAFKISGSAVGTYDGSAVFGAVEDLDESGTDAFVIVLFADDSGSEAEESGAVLTLLRVGTDARPAPGTYAVGDPTAESPPATGDFVAVFLAPDLELFALGVGGNVTITASSSTTVAGQVAVNAVDGSGQNLSAQYTITGTYDAVNGDVGGFLPAQTLALPGLRF